MTVSGTVQGIGFRPFVYRAAVAAGVTGFVRNDDGGVIAELEGTPAAVESVVAALRDQPPPGAQVQRVVCAPTAPRGDAAFAIVESRNGRLGAGLPPDLATCAECRAEVADPLGRRYRYPFTTCASCGPRFTITLRLPYDRPNTSMAGFTMCAACLAEYRDPADRRFHAQTLACPVCGPQLALRGTGEEATGDAALRAAQRLLEDGAIVAVKGIGGYHLACDARNSMALDRLRARKHRAHKPFALMVRDVAAARAVGVVGDDEQALLTASAAPIVLLDRVSESPLADCVAPGSRQVGVMLPYSPLHHLLLEDTALHEIVLTSGNRNGEPICRCDDDAQRRLQHIADAFLGHDRPIHMACDDSVVRIVDGAPLPLRRSRGHTPLNVRLPAVVPPLAAVGGELKSAACVARHRNAWLGAHLGDIGSVVAGEALARSITGMNDLCNVRPEYVVCDEHPGYLSRAWAAATGPGKPLTVQHHHAHLAALLAEHERPVETEIIGVIFDGTGYGSDGTLWGGELLLGGYGSFLRVGSLKPVALSSGDAVVRRPALAALAHLFAAGLEWGPDLAPVRALVQRPGGVSAIRTQLERGIGCIASTSLGRLMDAVASLLGLRHEVTYEGQAAVELEWLAAGWDGRPCALRLGVERRGEAVWLDPAPLLEGVVGGLRAGTAPAAIAAGTHRAVVDGIVAACEMTRTARGVRTVGLSGGAFQNALLAHGARQRLLDSGFEVLTHHRVPPNDGGLSLGQAAVIAGRAHLARTSLTPRSDLVADE